MMNIPKKLAVDVFMWGPTKIGACHRPSAGWEKLIFIPEWSNLQ
jgi:hypothetical protein